MKCVFCDGETKVIDSRFKDKNNGQKLTLIRRRRECLKCGKRFTTYEFPVLRNRTSRKKLLNILKLDKKHGEFLNKVRKIQRFSKKYKEDMKNLLTRKKCGQDYVEVLQKEDDDEYMGR